MLATGLARDRSRDTTSHGPTFAYTRPELKAGRGPRLAAHLPFARSEHLALAGSSQTIRPKRHSAMSPSRLLQLSNLGNVGRCSADRAAFPGVAGARRDLDISVEKDELGECTAAGR